MTNVQQAEAVIKKYKFNFFEIPKEEIRKLIEKEIYKNTDCPEWKAGNDRISTRCLEELEMKLKRRLKVY